MFGKVKLFIVIYVWGKNNIFNVLECNKMLFDV